MTSVYLLGIGKHATEIKEYLESDKNFGLSGYIVDDHYVTAETLTSKKAYSLTEFLQSVLPSESVYLIGAIGSPLRKKMIDKLVLKGYQFINLIHEHCYISKSVQLGVGNCIAPGTSINANVKIADHCIVNTNCTISHDTILDDYVTLSPGVNLAGNVSVGKGVFIGIGASVIPDIIIGEGAFIAAGACVVKDVLPYTLVGGVPAKLIKNLEP